MLRMSENIKILPPRYSTYHVGRGKTGPMHYMYLLTVDFGEDGPIRHVAGIRLMGGVLRPPAVRRGGRGYKNVCAWTEKGALDLAESVARTLPALRMALTPSGAARLAHGANIGDARDSMLIPDVVKAAGGLLDESFDRLTRLAAKYEGGDAEASKVMYAEVNAVDREIL